MPSLADGTDWEAIARAASAAAAAKLAEAGYSAEQVAASLGHRGSTRPASHVIDGARHVAAADATEREHLESGLLAPEDVEEAARGRLDVARHRVAGIEDRWEAADEAGKVVREVIERAEVVILRRAVELRDAAVRFAIERLGDGRSMSGEEREAAERLIRSQEAAAALGHGLPLPPEVAEVVARVSEDLEEARAGAAVVTEAAEAVRVVRDRARRRIASFGEEGISSGRFAEVERLLAADATEGRVEVDAAMDAARGVVELVRAAIVELEEHEAA
jgi:hypothetical protein